jgi:hypothetical protein
LVCYRLTNRLPNQSVNPADNCALNSTSYDCCSCRPFCRSPTENCSDPPGAQNLLNRSASKVDPRVYFYPSPGGLSSAKFDTGNGPEESTWGAPVAGHNLTPPHEGAMKMECRAPYRREQRKSTVGPNRYSAFRRRSQVAPRLPADDNLPCPCPLHSVKKGAPETPPAARQDEVVRCLDTPSSDRHARASSANND